MAVSRYYRVLLMLNSSIERHPMMNDLNDQLNCDSIGAVVVDVVVAAVVEELMSFFDFHCLYDHEDLQKRFDC